MDKEEEIKKSLILIRHELASIDLSDIKNIEDILISDAEVRQREADSEIFYIKYFEKLLKLLTQKQLEYVGTQAQSDLQSAFGRGTINGFYLIDQWFKEQLSGSRGRFSEVEKPKPGDNPVDTDL
jgi:hypothetical protein